MFQFTLRQKPACHPAHSGFRQEAAHCIMEWTRHCYERQESTHRIVGEGPDSGAFDLAVEWRPLVWG